MNFMKHDVDAKTSLISTSLRRAESLQRRLEKLSGRIQVFENRLRFHQNARLSAAGVFFVGLFLLTLAPELQLEIPWILVFATVFGTLVIRTRNLQRHLHDLEGLRDFSERQRRRLVGQPSGRLCENAVRAAVDLPLQNDLGLVGAHSLFTLIDETLTDRGERRLLEWISSPLLDSAEIETRQKKVQALRHETWFYARLGLLTRNDEFRLSTDQILEFLKRPFVSDKFHWFFVANMIGWVAMILAVTVTLVSGEGPSPSNYVAAFALLSLWSLSQSGSSFSKGVGLSHHLSQLVPIFERVEKRASHQAWYRTHLPTLSKMGPAQAAKQVNRVLNFLGVQANPLLYLILNALTPWTLLGSFLLERRRRQLAETFPHCLGELAEYEALASLAVLERFQTRTYPHVGPHSRFECQKIFHPLVDRNRVVANDFVFPEGKSLGLLTGSNMSGKSTFLRTLGLNQTLAGMGAPVFAESFSTRPLRIGTCIEVSDSLRDGFSYFYAEVRRLKTLLSGATAGEPILYLIDEIFRGTNNRERQIGSRAVIRTLARAPQALGFVSTHDLELTALEDSTPAVLNLHFREEIRNGEMFFTYKLHPGPCPTTNALKIMEAEGIEIETL